jgi:hypothetical protein
MRLFSWGNLLPNDPKLSDRRSWRALFMAGVTLVARLYALNLGEPSSEKGDEVSAPVGNLSVESAEVCDDGTSKSASEEHGDKLYGLWIQFACRCAGWCLQVFAVSRFQESRAMTPNSVIRLNCFYRVSVHLAFMQLLAILRG